MCLELILKCFISAHAGFKMYNDIKFPPLGCNCASRCWTGSERKYFKEHTAHDRWGSHWIHIHWTGWALFKQQILSICNFVFYYHQQYSDCSPNQQKTGKKYLFMDIWWITYALLFILIRFSLHFCLQFAVCIKF